MTEVTPPALPANPRGSRVHPLVQAAIAIAVSLAVIVAVIALGFQNWQQQQQIAALSAGLQTANDQVISLGAQPDAPAPETITGEPGPVGPAGQAGADGDDGISVTAVSCTADGTWQVTYSTGRTQTVPGPCIAQNGATGAAGQNGTDGAPGAPGANGADGQPPQSWTFTYLLTDYTCTRTTPFDPTAPTYTCAAS